MPSKPEDWTRAQLLNFVNNHSCLNGCDPMLRGWHEAMQDALTEVLAIARDTMPAYKFNKYRMYLSERRRRTLDPREADRA